MDETRLYLGGGPSAAGLDVDDNQGWARYLADRRKWQGETDAQLLTAIFALRALRDDCKEAEWCEVCVSGQRAEGLLLTGLTTSGLRTYHTVRQLAEKGAVSA